MGIDIGFSSLLIVILFITPGLIFRRFYFQGEFTKQFRFQNLTLSLVFSLFIGVIIQVVSFTLYKSQIEVFVLDIFKPYDSFFSHLSEIYDSIKSFDALYVTEKSYYFFQIIIFVCYSYFAAILSSIFSWSFVRLLKLDRLFKIFRFSNHWNYYFKGEIKDFSEFAHLDKGKVLYTEADVVIQSNSGERKMFSGILSQYTIEPKTNKLENIYLTNVKKWKEFKDENGNKTKLKPVSFKSDCLILNYDDVFNINLNYVYRETKKVNFYLPLLFLISTIFISVSKHELLYSSNLFFTITTKISAIIFLLWILVLIEFAFMPKSKERKSTFVGTITMVIIHLILHTVFSSIF